MDLGVVQKGVWRDTATLWGDRHDSERLQWRERQQWLQLTDLRDIEPGVHSLSVTFRQQFAKKKRKTAASLKRVQQPWGCRDFLSSLISILVRVLVFKQRVLISHSREGIYKQMLRWWEGSKFGEISRWMVLGFFVLVFFVTGNKFAEIVQFSRLEDSNVLTQYF